MESKMQIGLLLIVGTIVSLIGWMFIYPVDGGLNTTATDQANQLLADPGMGKLGLLMGFGGMMAVFLGLLNMSRSMAAAGGRGSSYANISAVLAMILLSVSAIKIGLEFTATEATSAAAGATLREVGGALDLTFVLTSGLLLILLGIGIARAKTFHVIAAALAVIAGALFVLTPFAVVDMLGFIG